MAIYGQLQYFEELVRFDAQMLRADNSLLAECITELRGVWENRSVLRHLRLLAGIPIRNGDGHCLENPAAKCMCSHHETCAAHTDSCYLCPFLSAVKGDC
jgi:hypothetical protein